MGTEGLSSATRVALVNLGCRVNRVETDVMARQFIDAGCELCGQDEADAIVINTCAVTSEAQAKTRKAVRHAMRLEQGPIVVACGCAANLFAEELRDAAPGVLIELQKGLVARHVLEALHARLQKPPKRSYLALAPTPTGRMRPGIKIQDGCDNRCTFCIVWKGRGPSRSLSSLKVLSAVNEACEHGAHEVVLTGINLGNYRAPQGDLLGEGAGLDTLLSEVLSKTPIDRVRISSIEPPDVTDDLLHVMSQSNGRIAPFLHICLQSGSDSVLRRMGRTYDTNAFEQIVRSARGLIPNIAIGTDIIVGFPGESEEEFNQTMDFCRRIRFSKVHVFRYSRRPGTPAAEALDQVPAPLVAKRSQDLRQLAEQTRLLCASSLHEVVDDVLVIEKGRAVGGHLFEVKVKPEIEIGSYIKAKLKLDGYGHLKAEALA